MSSIGSLGSGTRELMAFLRRQLHELQPTNGAAQSPAGVAGPDANTASQSASAPASGSAPAGIAPSSLAIILTVQEQSPASRSVGTSSNPLDQLFSQIDTNGDGTISKSEFESAITAAGGTTSQADAIFAKLDSDGSGDISKGELASAAKGNGRAGRIFAKLDTNGDGQVSKSELEAAVTSAGGTNDQADAIFAKLDTNNDGTLSQNEIAAAMHGHHHGHGFRAAGVDGNSIARVPASTDPNAATQNTDPTAATGAATSSAVSDPDSDGDNHSGASAQAGGSQFRSQMGRLLAMFMQMENQSAPASVSLSA